MMTVKFTTQNLVCVIWRTTPSPVHQMPIIACRLFMRHETFCTRYSVVYHYGHVKKKKLHLGALTAPRVLHLEYGG